MMLLRMSTVPAPPPWIPPPVESTQLSAIVLLQIVRVSVADGIWNNMPPPQPHGEVPLHLPMAELFVMRLLQILPERSRT